LENNLFFNNLLQANIKKIFSFPDFYLKLFKL